MVIIPTASGGAVEIESTYSGIHGHKLYLHVDQNANIRNGEGEAGIFLTQGECKDIIYALNDYIKKVEGKDYVVLFEPLMEIVAEIEEFKKKKESEKEKPNQ